MTDKSLGEPGQPQSSKYPPELIEAALKECSDEEMLALYEEYEKTGGLQLQEFIGELGLEAEPHE